MTSSGCVEQVANTAKEAVYKVDRLIKDRLINTSDIEWGDPEYEDFSFGVTEDVDMI